MFPRPTPSSLIRRIKTTTKTTTTTRSRSTVASTSTPSLAIRTPTIFAPATGSGRQAISILRISGPEVLQVWRKMTIDPRPRDSSDAASTRDKGKGKMLVEGRDSEGSSVGETRDPPARKAMLRRIIHPTTREVLDEGLVLYFPASQALTSQPTLELHTHGSPALLALLLDVLPTLGEGFRIAEPGEFTRLAFESGKMDLTEVEGLRDLVDACTESQRRLAARQAGGQLKKSYDQMRELIIEATSLIEALIDFGEDAEIDQGVFQLAQIKIGTLRDIIARRLNDERRGEIIRSGIQLAIIGAPNAGKSTLLNWLAQREAAIVASTPGTTRDVVELSLDFHGFSVLVADTAGLRVAEEEVEQIGIERAKKKAQEADINLCLLSASEIFSSSPAASSSPSATIDPLTLQLIDKNTLVLLNKTDLLSLPSSSTPFQEYQAAIAECLRAAGKEWLGSEKGGDGIWGISVQQATGLKELSEGLKGEIKKRFELSDNLDDTPIVTQARHRRHLEECKAYLETFLLAEADDIVLAAEELRYAMLALGRITGAVDVEEVLGEIFRGFCVGK